MGEKKIVAGQKVDPKKLERAKQLRKSLTPAERRLWHHLCANRLGGWHFRRQQVIDGFIVDFYCRQAALVIEVDGPIHAHQKDIDAARMDAISNQGLKFLRFSGRFRTT